MRRRNVVEYQCGICHELQEQNRLYPITQCAVCAKFLCADCDNYGICPSHFKVLKQSDQNILARFAENEVKVNIYILILTGFLYALGTLAGGFLGAFILEALMPYPTISIPVLVVGVIFLIGFVVVFYYRSQLHAQRETIKITVEGILMQYPMLAAIIQERSG